MAQLPTGVAAEWVGTDTPQARALDAFDGIWMLPGTPYRDDERYAAGDYPTQSRGGDGLTPFGVRAG